MRAVVPQRAVFGCSAPFGSGPPLRSGLRRESLRPHSLAHAASEIWLLVRASGPPVAALGPAARIPAAQPARPQGGPALNRTPFRGEFLQRSADPHSPHPPEVLVERRISVSDTIAFSHSATSPRLLQVRSNSTAKVRVDESHGIADANRPAGFHVRAESQAAAESAADITQYLRVSVQSVGIDICQATAAKYMVRRRQPPSQTWRTFLRNHIGQVVAADSSVVPTATYRLLSVLVLPPTIGDASTRLAFVAADAAEDSCVSRRGKKVSRRPPGGAVGQSSRSWESPCQ